MTTTDYENLLEQMKATREDAETIEKNIPTLPTEFQQKAVAKLSQLASMQQLVANFARLEVQRIDSLQRINLSQVEPGGHA